jgi:hypothetical protein
MAGNRRGTLVIRFRLLGSSMSPLLLILGIRLWSTHTVVACLLLIAAVVFVGSLLLFVNARGRLDRQEFTLTAVRDESGQIPAYLVTYLVPFVTLNVDELADLLAYLVLAVVMVVLIVRTDLIYVQPVLLAIGWHLYRTEVKGGFEDVVMISGLDLKAGNEVSVVGLGGPVARVLSAA